MTGTASWSLTSCFRILTPKIEKVNKKKKRLKATWSDVFVREFRIY